jgi:hypothetical protein
MSQAMSGAEQAQGEAAAATEQAAAAATEAGAAQEAMDALTRERDALVAEVRPLRLAAVAAAKTIAAKLSPSVGLDACEDLASVRRAVVAARLPELAQASDDAILGAWTGLTRGLDSADSGASHGAPAAHVPTPGFMAPPVAPGSNAVASKSRALLARK